MAYRRFESPRQAYLLDVTNLSSPNRPRRDCKSNAVSDANSDQATAAAFATSWNSLSVGSVYTYDQFSDWLAPLTKRDVHGQSVLELGCGNGSLMRHSLDWQPTHLHGIDLGEAVRSARANLSQTPYTNWTVEQADLVTYRSEGFDLVYCIGVLHHLKDPEAGFRAVVTRTYARVGACIAGFTQKKEIAWLFYWLSLYARSPQNCHGVLTNIWSQHHSHFSSFFMPRFLPRRTRTKSSRDSRCILIVNGSRNADLVFSTMLCSINS